MVNVTLKNIVNIREDIRKQLEKAGYGLYNHSSVEICHWTKKSLADGGDCYKYTFYGIDSWACMQISQATAWCPNRCIYCWRPNEEFEPETSMLDVNNVDPPEIALEKLRELRKKLLIGYKGNPHINKEKLEKSLLYPTHITFSLSGEPLLYPYVPESIIYIKKNWPWVRSIFVVTSGQVPEELERMIELNAYPTQLYISYTGSTQDTYEMISRPQYTDYWDRFLRALDVGSKMKTRRVARITLIQGVNDDPRLFEDWAELIERFNPHFVEVKAFMLLGFSRYRLSVKNMPKHDYIRQWTIELGEYLSGYYYWNEHEPSRVAVLKNGNPGMDIDPIIRSPEPNV